MADTRQRYLRALARRAQGLCMACSRPRVPGNKNFCEVHRGYQRQYRRLYDRAAEYAKIRAQRVADRQAHPYTCQWCGQPIDPARFPAWRRYHPGCAQVRDQTRPPRMSNSPAHLRAVRAWQARKRQAGCCACCGKLRGAGSTQTLCRPCADKREQRRKAALRGGGRSRGHASG